MYDKLIQQLPFIDEENLKEFFEERAAVREYEGKLPRDLAEEAAFRDTVSYFFLTNHIVKTTKEAQS